YHTPWDGRFYFSVDDELIFAEPYHQNFLQSVRNFSGQQLADIIIHPGSGSENFLGNYLLRSAYHESVNAGQFIKLSSRNRSGKTLYLGLIHDHETSIQSIFKT